MSKRNEHINEVFQPFLNSLLPEVEKDELKCPECNCKEIFRYRGIYGCKECGFIWDKPIKK
jgi:ribosomal protein L37AE/L43A